LDRTLKPHERGTFLQYEKNAGKVARLKTAGNFGKTIRVSYGAISFFSFPVQ
jgi:hypothetical protein